VKFQVHEAIEVGSGSEKLPEVLILLPQEISARLVVVREAHHLGWLFNISHRVLVIVVELSDELSYLPIDEPRKVSNHVLHALGTVLEVFLRLGEHSHCIPQESFKSLETLVVMVKMVKIF
jgi:hypothetical protein